MIDLQRIVKLGEHLVARQADLEKAERAVAEIKAEIKEIEQEDIPCLMAELGVSEVKLASCGKTITTKQECEAGISEKNGAKAFAWLIKNGFGGLIKTSVAITFDRGEQEAAREAEEILAGQFTNRPVEMKETVHAATLKAFVREQLQAGKQIPMDLFGVYLYTKAVVKN